MNIGRSFARAIVVAALIVPLASCGYLDQVGAMRTFKEANLAYGRGDYEGAVEHYEEILAILDEVGEGDPLLNEQLTATYFYVANSYDNLYKPVRAGEPENDAFLEDAVRYYTLASERIRRSGSEAPVDAVPGCGVRTRQGERSGPVRARAAPDDPERPGESGQLLRPGQPL